MITGHASDDVEEEGEEQGQRENRAHVLPEEHGGDGLLAVLVQRGQSLHIDGRGSAVAQQQDKGEQRVRGSKHAHPPQS